MAPKSDEASAVDSNDYPLLNLPAELRNSIYELVFEDHGRVFTFVKRARTKAPGVLMACRQTYSEGVGLYYNGSVLCVANRSEMRLIAARTQHLAPKFIANTCHILLSCAADEALEHAKHPRYGPSVRLAIVRRAEQDLERLHRFIGLSNAEDALIRKVRYEIVGPGREKVFTSTPYETATEIERKWNSEYYEPRMLQHKSIAKYKTDKEATHLARIDGQEESTIGPWKILELEKKTSTDERAT